MSLPGGATLLALSMHECRGAIGTVGGYLSLLRHESHSWTGVQRELLNGAVRASDSMASLLDQLSDAQQWLDRAERGTRLPMAPVDLRAVLSAVLVPDRSDVALTHRTPAEPVMWHGDGEAMTAVLCHAAGRLARLHPDTTGCTLALSRETPSAARITLRRDSAEVVSDERVSFDLFRGAQGAATLLMAAIVAAHGGQLWDLRQDPDLSGVDVVLPLA